VRSARAGIRAVIPVVVAFALSAGTVAAQARPTQKPPATGAPAKATPRAGKPLPSRPVVLPASRRPGRPGSFEVTASTLWLGPGTAGTGEARLTENQAGGGGAGFTWFSARGEYASSAGVRATVGYNLSRILAVEAGLAYSPSRIRFVVSDDRELGSGFTSPGQRLSEYFIDGAVVAHLAPLAFSGGRGRPFVVGGGGYLRQLHPGRTVVETGQVFYAGGGVKYLLGPRARGLVRAFGLRIDGRLCVRSGGWNLGSDNTLSPAASAGILAAF
jgi:hypothetical protein